MKSLLAWIIGGIFGFFVAHFITVGNMSYAIVALIGLLVFMARVLFD